MSPHLSSILSLYTYFFLYSSKGYFIQPTIVVTTDPCEKLIKEEIFGPVLTVYVYDDCDLEETLDLIGNTTPFSLTGAIYAQDQ